MCKTMKQYFKRLHFDWKSLVIPWVVDERNQTETYQKTAKYFKYFIRVFSIGIFAICLLLIILEKLPDIKGAATNAGLWLFLYVAFCAIMNSLRFKKSNAGRKPKDNYSSFEDLFLDSKDYEAFNSYLLSHYSEERKLKSKDAALLLQALIKMEKLKETSFEPIVQLFLNKYNPYKIVSPSTPRAITKTTTSKDEINSIQLKLQQNSSK